MAFLYILLLVVGYTALAYDADVPQVLLGDISTLDDSSAEFLRAQINNGLVLNPKACQSFGLFCNPAGHTVHDFPMKESSLLGRKDLKHLVTKEDVKSQEVDKQPFGVGYPSWVFGICFPWKSDVVDKVDKQPPLPFGVGFPWTKSDGPQVDEHLKFHVHHHDASHQEDEKSLTARAFRLATLKAEEKILLPPIVELFPNKLIHPLLLDAMPFNKRNLPEVLKTFNLPGSSEMALSMQRALDMGKETSSELEVRRSVFSIREMTDFASDILCKDATKSCHLSSMAMAFENKHAATVKITDAQLMSSEDTVSCHTVPFPYMVYVCHKIINSPVYKVTLEYEGGKTVTAPVMCHMDTSHFDESHPAFKYLNMKPGEGEICHWLAYKTIVWYV